MHVCKKKKEIGELFFFKNKYNSNMDFDFFKKINTIVIWTLILKTNGIGHNPQYTNCINDCQLDSVFI